MFVAAFHLGYQCRDLRVAGKGADNIGVKAGKKPRSQIQKGKESPVMFKALKGDRCRWINP